MPLCTRTPLPAPVEICLLNENALRVFSLSVGCSLIMLLQVVAEKDFF